MASTPATELARDVLDSCLSYGTWPARSLDALIDRALDEEDEFASRAATRALFSIVIEHLADLFEPALCEVYARLFAHVISRALPDYDASDLLIRYRRIRQMRRFPGGEVQRVFVLSRVTLGADVALTSVALSAAQRRFPDAEISLVAPPKNAEMFAADTRITPIAIMYGRSSLLRDRLLAAAELQVAIDEPSSIVIDPDSRLTQLGLMPICDDARYFFFESRAFGGEIDAPLAQLFAEWLAEVFALDDVASKDLRPYVAPAVQPRIADVAVSWGVGDNEAKRIDDEFEYQVLADVLGRGWSVLLDRGAGGAEAARADRLVARLGAPSSLHLHNGSYASFASHILQSKLYVGYDSAGQHVAAAGGVPLVSVFAGYPCQRMLARWRPVAESARVIAVEPGSEASAVLARTLAAIAEVS